MTRRPTISKQRALLGAMALLLVAATLTGGWIWWTRPALRSVPLPEGTEQDEYMVVGPSLPSLHTNAGTVRSAGIRSEDHEWVARLRWTDLDRIEHVYELRLGESVDVESLGRMTLVRVEPAPLIDPNKFSWLPGVQQNIGGGSRIHFVLEFEDGVRECIPWEETDCARH